MTISIRQIHPVLVGEVTGIDLRQPLSSGKIAGGGVPIAEQVAA